MSREIRWGLAAVVVAAVSALVWSRTRSPRTPTPSAPTEMDQAMGEGRTPGETGAERAPATRPVRTPTALGAPGSIDVPAKPLTGAQVVARVNGVEIRGRDVVAFRAGQDEQSLEGGNYTALLRRAIERELTFQAAKQQGVALTDEQRAQLEQMKRQAIARGSTTPPFEPGTAEVELELRDTEANLLQTDLLAKAGTPAPAPTAADVDAYYKAHREEFGDLPEGEARAAAWAPVDAQIRTRLFRDRQQAWTAKRQEMLDGLEAAASISY